jgi:hypothetical protein
MEINQSIENPLGAGTQVGQAESFVYTPNQNVFATIQGALDKNLQLQQDDLKKKEEDKKKKDAALEKLMLDIQTDPKWDMPVEQMSNNINDIQNFVVDWRASGKPEDYNFQLALKKKMLQFDADKSMNEKTFDTYSKYMTEATANEKVDQEDVKLWENGLREQKDIKGRYDYIMNQPKPGEYFDILKPFKDNFSKEEQSGRKTETKESKQADAERAVWETRNPTERKRMLLLAGKNLELKDDNGNIRPATEAEYLDFVHKSMKPYYTKERTPTPMGGSGFGGGPKTTQPLITVESKYTTSTRNGVGGFADVISFNPAMYKDIPPAIFEDASGKEVEIKPSKLVFTGNDWVIRGLQVGGRDTFKSKSKEEADAFLAQGVQNGTIEDAEDVQQGSDGEWTFNYTTLKQIDVPYKQNTAKFQNMYQFDPYVVSEEWNRTKGPLAGKSTGGGSLNANTYNK